MVNSETCHENLLNQLTPALAFDKHGYTDAYKKALKEKFIQLTGIDVIAKNACEPNLKIVRDEDKGDYRLIRFEFFSEVEETVPCYLLIPNTGKEKYPVAITLQGHSTGFHNSINEPKYEKDFDYQPRGAFAVQAVQNGFIALAIEQRGLGERRSVLSYGKDNVFYPRPHMCAASSLRAIALGRTIIGERVWDISRAIDMLSYFPQCDTDKILVTGNSGGGTMSFYSACYDERIKLSVPSCSFCSYAGSILRIEHCACNYIPGVCDWFEMQDLSALIAPRKLTVVTGGKDEIFPLSEVEKSYETVQRVYAQAGASENCRLLVTPKAHWWCEDIVWPEICKQAKSLGW